MDLNMVRRDIHIRPASHEHGQSELKAILRILTEAADLMAAKGETRWESDQLTLDHLSTLVSAQELYAVISDDRIVGTFKLQTEDSLFWPEAPRDQAIYLHKIAVEESMRGQGLTQEVIRWAKSYAAQRRIKYIRLDTDRARPSLCRLYASLGFSFHSFKKLDWIEVMKFQMET